MNRRKTVIGNWKMNFTHKETASFLEKFKTNDLDKNADVIFCVPFTDISAAVNALSDTNIKVGAQNLYFEEKGAYTGEVSAKMLSECGVEYVIIGHSERRSLFNETDEIINKKVKKALEYNLKPILCCGETLSQRERGIEYDFIRTQIKSALYGISKEDAKNIVIAYEPIWAIGTGNTATNEQAEEMCLTIRNCVKELYGEEFGEKIIILYGGSVNTKTASELFKMENIDGGLVGSASLKDDFSVIVNA